MAKDEARKGEHRPRNRDKKYRLLAAFIAPAGEARRRHDVTFVPALYQFPDGRLRMVGLRREKAHKWRCAICGEKYDWKQPNGLLVVQTGESVYEAKVFEAHAVPQGLCGNLVSALKLLANQ